uniref:Mitochondrial fission 1 protein n=1 Tax=Wollemia nobilis TaxID=56998 RepID=A0A0C9QST1_9CONI
MADKLNNIMESVVDFFGSGDYLPWTDADIIVKCEQEAAGQGDGVTKDSDKSESIMRLSWALVHSRQAADVQRGIAMLEVALHNGGSPLQRKEILYLLAVGHFRAGDYSRSRRYIEQALQIAPDFRQALTLKKLVEDKITKDGVLGIGLAAAAVGVVAGGLTAAIARKR